MEFPYILALMITGAFAGFVGSMLGLGGAFIMTPVQVIIYEKMGISPDLALLMAFGTSLFAVLPTAVSATWRHHQNKAVLWRAVVIMGVTSSIAGFGGATLAAHIPQEALSIAFAVVLLLAGIRMVFSRQPEFKIEAETRPWLWIVWAVPIGLISGTFGVGGGIVTVPILVLALKFEVHYAVGTSMAIIMLTSIGGIIGYIVNGLGVAGRPDFSMGYINLVSWLLLVVPAAAMAQMGAAAAHKIPRRPLMIIFFCLLVFLSLRMIGVFEWIGWSI